MPFNKCGERTVGAFSDRQFNPKKSRGIFDVYRGATSRGRLGIYACLAAAGA
jgi:hypothetical protein